MIMRSAVPPLEPDQPTGRDWVLEELAKNEYAQARPNLVDELFNRIWEWIGSLFRLDPGDSRLFNPLLLIIAVVIVVVAIALVLLGRPRAIATRTAAPGGVFLDDDDRSAAELRAAADAAAGAGDWSLAITERYRAISRALSDRTLIALRPGTTAQGVAAAAAPVFPADAGNLHRAADAFDAVRYLGRRGDERGYALLRELDARLEQTRPATVPGIPASTGAAR